MGMFSVLAAILIACSAHASVTAISEHVERAVHAVAAATSYADWKDSGATPEALFAEVATTNTPEAWNELCAKLSSLPDQDLAFFDNEIDAAASSAGLSCRAALDKRLAAYWARETVSLEDFHHAGLELEGVAPPAVAGGQPLRDPVLGPSEERVVEAAKGPVFFDGNLKHGEIALTFDDGPHPSRTQKILGILKRAGIRATFFEVGEMARRNPQISKLVVSAGHTVGSHTWDHPQLPKLALSAAESNILLGRKSVIDAAGVDSGFFRFPYGARSKPLQAFVQNLKLASFFWNMDSLDWKLRNPTELFKNVLVELNREKGGIILFHDIQEQTTIVLPHVLEELKSRGFKTIVFVPQATPPKP